MGTGGQPATGGSGTGGERAAGGSPGTGGSGTGGLGTGGSGTGGLPGSGGIVGTGGTNRGGNSGTGGAAGARGTGGTLGGSGGAKAGNSGSGGATGTGGNSGGGGAVTVDCSTAVPSGGTAHTVMSMSGMAAGLTWSIWSNQSPGTITTYSVPAFGASWNNNGDFLARLGVQWNDTKTYDQYGTISSQFVEKKTGTGGQYSYIGVYGWSTNPCVEFYIVEDSFNQMPVNPGSTTMKGTVDIDGGTYIIYLRPTTGTGGSNCQGVSSWNQFYSVRKTARTCGTISISQHFAAWAAAGLTLGKMDQAQLLVEVGGGSGSVDFAVANVTTTQ
jgi:endo-1,4-beta-xylanase